ncbi:MAG: GNAT family N-acetyltransferase [Candidatus Zixiibacteriota bacterium]
MKDQPIIKTKRLLLRPFTLNDAKDVQRLAGMKEVAETTLNIPHPYEDGMAEEWISGHKKNLEEDKTITYAITSKDNTELIGAISLVLNLRHQNAEVGYWIGVPFWNNGYCTESLKAIIRYGFEELKLNRIHAHHYVRNEASGKVMQKAGMQFEGYHRQYVISNGVFEDVKSYAILKSDLQELSK